MIKKNMFRKLLISFLASIILLFSLVPYFSPAQALFHGMPDTWYAPEFGTFVDKVYDEDNPEEIFGERYTHAQVVWIIHSLTAILLPEFILTCMTIDDLGDAGACIAGALSAILPIVYLEESTSLASTFDTYIANNPISGIGYLKELAEKFHLVPEAKAQGFGFQNLEPIRAIWIAVRDISYFLMIFAFVIMAFMIMFRTKTSPQTVITVQSALPRLILILILVTFSYAISGFVVDLSYLSLGLVAILGSSLSGLDPLGLFNMLITSLPIISIFLVPMIAVLVLFITGGILSFPFLGPVVLIIGAVLTLLIFLVFLIIMLRILWLMIKTFVNVVLLVIASPILILLGVFPAAGGFSTWLKNLISHVVVFPAIIAMVFLAHFVFWISLSPGSAVATVLSPIDILNPYQINVGSGGETIELPGFNLGDSTIFGIIVAFGVLFLIPSLGNVIQGLISGRPFAYGSAIGQALAVPAFAGRAGVTGGVARGGEILQASGLGTRLKLGKAEATPQAKTLRDVIGRARRGGLF